MKDFWNNLANAFSTPANAIFSVLDLVLTIVIVYGVAMFFKKNNASRLVKYLAVLVVLSCVILSHYVNMPVLSKILGNVILLLLIAALVLFAPEIKRMMWKIASPKATESSYTTQYDCSDEELHAAIDDIVRAAQNMSKKDVGALIIIAPDNIPEHILDSGTRLDADLSCPLIECLFNTKAPLHDGAVYIRGNKILAAGCFLPLTQQTDLDKELGTRHRAAIGITEQYNHLAIMRYFDTQMLTDVLEQIYGLKAVGKPNKRNKRKAG